MKKPLWFAIIIGILIMYFLLEYGVGGETFKTSYGTALPPNLPSGIPVIDGKIMSSFKAVNIYGNTGYSISIETLHDISYVLNYYNNEFRKAGNPEGSIRKAESESASEDLYHGEGAFSGNRVLLEIMPRGDATKINTSIHLAK